MAEKKEKTYPSQLDKVKEITDQLEAGLEKLFDSDAFKQYLTTLSKFHDYSLNNTLLIAMQNLWHWRYFDIKPVRCGEAAPFPFQQPRRVQFIKRPLDGGAAFIQYFCYLRDGIDNINPALVVQPLVFLGEGGTV